MEPKKINQVVVDDQITGFFAVRKRDLREYSKGKYVSLELGDATGRLAAVVWEPDLFCLNDLEEGMVVKAQGRVGEYNGRPQLTVSRIRAARKATPITASGSPSWPISRNLISFKNESSASPRTM